MKQFLFLLLFAFYSLCASAQLFKNEDLVEVEPTLSDTLASQWKKATVTGYDTSTKIYSVKLADGNKFTIPSKTPEKWIRPVVNKTVVNKYGPGARFPYQKTLYMQKNIRCNPSEAGVKKNISILMAGIYKEFTHIFVDFTSFKGQNGYDDKKIKGRFVYPYKIEMLVHLKRTLLFAGKEYTEYQTWEFDRIYEYASKLKKGCEFYALPSSDAKLVSRAWY